MGKRDLITKDFALYVVHYFNAMQTWSKKDILGEIDRTIKEAKPEDAVRVVRCKDCKHCDIFQGETTLETMMLCMIHLFEVVDPTDFCSYGERRNNATD